MNINKQELHVVTTNRQSFEDTFRIICAIHPYVDQIHIREKTWSACQIAALVQRLYQHGVPRGKMVINDRVDVAVVMETSGIHLARHSLNVAAVKEKFSTMRIGCSVHTIEAAQEAQDAGANYCIFGHIFPTDSKKMLAARGLKYLRRLVENLDVPIIAIGGISAKNVNEVIQTGVDGVAVMSGVFLAEDPLQAVKQLRKNMKKGGD